MVVPKPRRSPHQCTFRLGGTKPNVPPASVLQGYRLCQTRKCPRDSAAGALRVPKRRRRPQQCRVVLGGPKAENALAAMCVGLGAPKRNEASAPMWQRPESSQTGECPRANAAGSLFGPKRRRPQRPCNAGLYDHKAKDAHALMGHRPRGTQTKRGPRTNVVGASVERKWRIPLHPRGGTSVLPKGRRPPRVCDRSLSSPKPSEAPVRICRGPRYSKGKKVLARARRSPDDPKAKEAPAPMRRKAHWSQSRGGVWWSQTGEYPRS